MSRHIEQQMMVKEYKFLRIEGLKITGRKTPIFNVLNRGSKGLLAEIRWYAPWRQYCFFPLEDTVWNDGCLTDVKDFLGKVNEMKYVFTKAHFPHCL